MRVIERGGITRPVGKKNSVGIESQYFLSGRGGGHHSDFKSFLSKQAENVSLDAVVVRGNPKANRWPGSCAFAVWAFISRPRLAMFTVRITADNLLCVYLVTALHPLPSQPIL